MSIIYIQHRQPARDPRSAYASTKKLVVSDVVRDGKVLVDVDAADGEYGAELEPAEVADLVDNLSTWLSLNHYADLSHTLRRVALRARADAERPPLALWLTCPRCAAQHVDEGEFATKPHHTHACQSCGLTWRPSVEPTVGVKFLPGFKNVDA